MALICLAATESLADDLPTEIVTGSVDVAETGSIEASTQNDHDGDGAPLVDPEMWVLNLKLADPQELWFPAKQEDVARIEPAVPADSPALADRLSTIWTYGSWQISNTFDPEIQEGALDFTPTLGYRYKRDDGTIIEPRLALKSTWEVVPFVGAFDNAQLSGLKAHLEGGVTIFDNDGWSVDASTSVRGVTDPGGALEWRTDLGVKVPLN